MPLDKESMKAKLKKKTELKEKILKGLISNTEAITIARMFNRSLDKYGLCEPDVIANYELDDVD